MLCEAEVCWYKQPIILIGDFNADPSVIPSFAKGTSDGGLIDLEVALPLARGLRPHPTCQFQRDEGRGTRRDFALVSPKALAASTSCSVLPDLRFPPHFALLTEFSLAAWALRLMARVYPPIWARLLGQAHRSHSKLRH